MARLLLAVTAAFCAVAPSMGQFGAMGDDRKVFPSNKKDAKYIGCDVCALAAAEAFRAVVIARSELKRGETYSETSIEELVESMCDVDHGGKNSSWLGSLDIATVSRGVLAGGGSELVVTRNPGFGHCEVECMTAARSCATLMESKMDIDAFAAALWKGKMSEEVFVEAACTEWSERCPKGVGKSASRKKLPASYVREDHEWLGKSDQDHEMEQLMAEMKTMGMQGNMYGRDDMDGLLDSMGDGDSLYQGDL